MTCTLALTEIPRIVERHLHPLRRLRVYFGSNIIGPTGYSVHTLTWRPFQTFRAPDDSPCISATGSWLSSDGGVRHR
jgi:hypothetical protein